MRLPNRLAVFLLSILSMSVVFAAGWHVDGVENARYQSSLRTLVTERAAALRSGIEKTLNADLSILIGLETLVRACPECGEKEFQAVAARMAEQIPGVRAIQLAPDAIVSRVYPLLGNEAALGVDLRSLPGQGETVKRTIVDGRTILAGPVNLVQGGTGLIGRKPIFLESGSEGKTVFWGFATVVLDFQSVLERAGWLSYDDHCRFALRGLDGRGEGGGAFLGDSAIFTGDHVSLDVNFPGGVWHIGGEPVAGWYQDRPDAAVFRLLLLCIAVGVGVGVWHLVRLYLGEREARAKLVMANAAKGMFMARMSHELRTPLNAIIGFSEVMREEVLGRHSVPRYKEYADDIHNSGTHLLELVNTILDMEKVEAGRFDIWPEPVDLGGFVPEVMRLVELQARRAEVHLLTDIPAGQPALLVDRRAMRQMLLNLLSNAVKFSHPGGKVVVRVRSANGGMTMVSVTDEGIGIALDDMDKILKPFGQVENSMTRTKQGTGLGLSLTKALVELHGGRLDLFSAPGRGTTITLRFPSQGEEAHRKSETAPLGAVA